MKEKETDLETLEFHPLQSTESNNSRTNLQKEKDVRHQAAAKYTTHIPLREANKLSQRKRKGRTVEMQSAPYHSQRGSHLLPKPNMPQGSKLQ